MVVLMMARRVRLALMVAPTRVLMVARRVGLALMVAPTRVLMVARRVGLAPTRVLTVAPTRALMAGLMGMPMVPPSSSLTRTANLLTGLTRSLWR